MEKVQTCMGFYYPSFFGGDDHHPLWESLLVPPRIQHDIVGISWDMFDILFWVQWGLYQYVAGHPKGCHQGCPASHVSRTSLCSKQHVQTVFGMIWGAVPLNLRHLSCTHSSSYSAASPSSKVGKW